MGLGQGRLMVGSLGEVRVVVVVGFLGSRLGMGLSLGFPGVVVGLEGARGLGTRRI